MLVNVIRTQLASTMQEVMVAVPNVELAITSLTFQEVTTVYDSQDMKAVTRVLLLPLPLMSTSVTPALTNVLKAKSVLIQLGATSVALKSLELCGNVKCALVQLSKMHSIAANKRIDSNHQFQKVLLTMTDSKK